MAGNEVTEQVVLQALSTVIGGLNEERPEDRQLGSERTSMLYGAGGELDSLDLVRLVVLFEQQINEDTGCVVSLADDRAMSTENSHFQTVGSLVAYTLELMEE